MKYTCPAEGAGGEALCPGSPASKSKTTNLNRPAHNSCPAETVVTVNRTDINKFQTLNVARDVSMKTYRRLRLAVMLRRLEFVLVHSCTSNTRNHQTTTLCKVQHRGYLTLTPVFQKLTRTQRVEVQSELLLSVNAVFE